METIRRKEMVMAQKKIERTTEKVKKERKKPGPKPKAEKAPKEVKVPKKRGPKPKVEGEKPSKKLTAARNKKRGKGFQGKLAKMWLGKNVGTLGGEDVEHPKYSIEAKTQKRFVGQKFMDQAIANCPRGKIAIVHVHVIEKRHPEDIIMIRYKDFMALTEPKVLVKRKKGIESDTEA